MTLEYADGWDTLASGVGIVDGWSVTGTGAPWVNSSDRYAGDGVGRSIQGNGSAFGLSGTTGLIRSSLITHATNYFGFAVLPTLDFNSTQIFRVYDNSSGTNVLATLWFIDKGTNLYGLELRLGSVIGGTLLCGTTVAVVDTANWYYVELKYVVGAAGSAEIRVNELVVATASGIDTRNGFSGGTIAAYAIWSTYAGNSSNGSPRWDDFYHCTGGGANNNDYLGDVRVVRLRPNAAGSNSEFTPVGDATNHYENVNNDTASAGVYNSSGVDEATEYYNVDNLPASATGAILAAVTRLGAWCTVLNVGLATLTKDSTTELEHAEVALTTTVSSLSNVIVDETKPSGGAWTTAEINATQLGVRVKSIT